MKTADDMTTLLAELDALIRPAAGHSRYRTLGQLAADAGWPLQRMRKALAMLKDKGRLLTGPVTVVGLSGQARTVVGFAIAPAKKK